MQAAKSRMRVERTRRLNLCFSASARRHECDLSIAQ
jgi:hypothetical protein